MPLRAFIDGREVIAPLVGDEEWETLRRKVRSKSDAVQMACCESSGFLRNSKLGTKHFVHARAGQCNWEPETMYHLRAKQDILHACGKAGFAARPEVPGADWRADVLAAKGKIQIAFEVQWSGQTEEETRRRQRRYDDAGIRCCWFMRKPPEVFVTAPAKAFPVFQLSVADDKSLQVSLNDNSWPLQEFTESLLCRRVRYCSSATLDSVQHVTVVFFRNVCWRCEHPSHMYYVEEPYQSRCGISCACMEGFERACDNTFAPEIVAAVEKFLTTNEGHSLRVGKIKSRYSRTERRSYPSFGCPQCHALFGEFFRGGDTLDARCDKENAPAIFEAEVSCRAISAPHAHWCFPTNGVFCGEPN